MKKPSWTLHLPGVLLLIGLVFPGFTFDGAAWASTDSDRLPLAAGICANKARDLFQQGRIQSAIDTLEEFIHRPKTKKHPGMTLETIKARGYNHPYLHFILGNYYSALSQDSPEKNAAAVQQAILSYTIAVRENPLFFAAWLNLARCCYEAGKYENAALAFEKGYEHSKPKKAIHLYYAVVCHFQSQNHEKALALFTVLLKNHPDQVTLAWKEVLVNILFSLDRYQAALPHVEGLAEKSGQPRQKKWQQLLLQQYLTLEMDANALAFARELVQKDPLEPVWWKALSHIHLKTNNLDKGLSALIIYGFLTPMTIEERELEADLYLALDIPGKAASLYQDIIQQDHTVKTLEKLIQAYALAHDPDNAIKWINNRLSGMETAESNPGQAKLIHLKKQLLNLQEFFAKASPVLQPEKEKKP